MNATETRFAARKALEKLFDTVQHTEKLFVRDAETGGIIYTLESAFPDAVRLTRELAPFFKRKTDLETVEAVWKFERNQIKYRKDETGRQDIRLPSFFLWSNTGDCKSYSLFAAAILYNLGFHVAFRYAMYRVVRGFSHVYCVAEKNNSLYICDGVYSKFNEEKKPLKTKTHFMNTYILGSIEEDARIESAMQQIVLEYMAKPEFKALPPNVQRTRLVNLKKEIQRKVQTRLDAAEPNHVSDDLGAVKKPKLTKEQKKAKRKKIAGKVKKFWSKLGHGFMFVNLLPIRAAFNAIVAMNFNSLAHNLRWVYQNRDGLTKAEWAKIKKVWYNVGGIEKALLKAIELGAKHKPLFLSKKAKAKFQERKKNQKGYAGIGDLPSALDEDIEGLGFPPAVAAGVAAASGIIAAILPPIMMALKKGGKPQQQAAEEVAQQGEQLVQDVKSGTLKPEEGFGVERENSLPMPEEAGEAQQPDAPEEAPSVTGYDDYEMIGFGEIGAIDLSALTSALTQVATIGIEAGAKAIKKKADKKPKLKKFLEKGNEAVENYAVGHYLKKSGATNLAKSFASNPNTKYYLMAAGVVVVGGGIFLATRKGK